MGQDAGLRCKTTITNKRVAKLVRVSWPESCGVSHVRARPLLDAFINTVYLVKYHFHILFLRKGYRTMQTGRITDRKVYTPFLNLRIPPCLTCPLARNLSLGFKALEYIGFPITSNDLNYLKYPQNV